MAISATSAAVGSMARVQSAKNLKSFLVTTICTPAARRPVLARITSSDGRMASA